MCTGWEQEPQQHWEMMRSNKSCGLRCICISSPKYVLFFVFYLNLLTFIYYRIQPLLLPPPTPIQLTTMNDDYSNGINYYNRHQQQPTMMAIRDDNEGCNNDNKGWCLFPLQVWECLFNYIFILLLLSSFSVLTVLTVLLSMSKKIYAFILNVYLWFTYPDLWTYWPDLCDFSTASILARLK